MNNHSLKNKQRDFEANGKGGDMKGDRYFLVLGLIVTIFILILLPGCGGGGVCESYSRGGLMALSFDADHVAA